MTPTSRSFGTTKGGQAVQLHTLANAHGMQVALTDFGGTITRIMVPDRTGASGDVLLGFDDVGGYQSPEFLSSDPHFGALIGRYANRIRGGSFTLNGRRYVLARNDGENAMHGGLVGFDKVVWDAVASTSAEGQTVTLRHLSKDGDEGYPGNLEVTVTYTLTSGNALRIHYAATTDQPTPVNLTNHAYFNLALGQAEDVLGHEMMIAADRFTVVDEHFIPTGELRPVRDTPFDFTAGHPIGERMAQVPGGYDHNWVLDRRGGLQLAATVYEPATGRTLEVMTTEPGLQCYTSNFLDGTLRGRDGIVYGKHVGLCLESQHFPDSPNQPDFPSTLLNPGQTLASTTVYTFGMRR